MVLNTDNLNYGCLDVWMWIVVHQQIVWSNKFVTFGLIFIWATGDTLQLELACSDVQTECITKV